MSSSVYLHDCCDVISYSENAVHSKPAGLLSSALYMMNPSVIYMGIVPMMEAPFVMFFMLSVYYFQKWYYEHISKESSLKQYRILVKCSLAISLACLTRYEGWLLPLGLIFAILFILLFITREPQKRADRAISVCRYHIQYGGDIIMDILEYGGIQGSIILCNWSVFSTSPSKFTTLFRSSAFATTYFIVYNCGCGICDVRYTNSGLFTVGYCKLFVYEHKKCIII